MKPQIYKGFVIRAKRTHIIPGPGKGMQHFPLNKYQFRNLQGELIERDTMRGARRAIDAIVDGVPA